MPVTEEQKKESHRTMKLFSRRTDNGFHNSRQVAKRPMDLVHGIAGTKSSARYDSPIPDLKSQLGYAQDLGRGPLLTGQLEHTDKLGAGEAFGTDDVAVSEVRHTAVTNSKNSVLSGRIESVLSMKITQALLDDLTAQAKASPGSG